MALSVVVRSLLCHWKGFRYNLHEPHNAVLGCVGHLGSVADTGMRSHRTDSSLALRSPAHVLRESARNGDGGDCTVMDKSSVHSQQNLRNAHTTAKV
jgi:hypothetical protein